MQPALWTFSDAECSVTGAAGDENMRTTARGDKRRSPRECAVRGVGSGPPRRACGPAERSTRGVDCRCWRRHATTRDRAARVMAGPAAEPSGGRVGPGRTALDDTQRSAAAARSILRRCPSRWPRRRHGLQTRCATCAERDSPHPAGPAASRGARAPARARHADQG
jgi:hypothetical protein